MNNKICMITGANAGIGRATALGLAKLGATVVMVCRNRDLGEAARQEIIVENVFAVNYLAPFLLTNLLLDVLKDSAPARVVNVAGDFHRKATIQFDDLMSEQSYSGTRANNQAKLALILFTYELARRLEGTGVTANCLHPGATATDAPLNDPDLSGFDRAMYRLVRVFFQGPEQGAATSIYLASSPEVEGVTGKYFVKQQPVASSPESYDVATAQHLWEVSSQLVGLAS